MKKNIYLIVCFAGVVSFYGLATLKAQNSYATEINHLRFANIFGNNMVIQQGINAPVWGNAFPGEKIRIVFAGYTSETQARDDGKWMIRMPELKAGGPYEMVIIGNSTLVLNNVMVGVILHDCT